MKHIFLASLGGTSQVITETLWALMNPDKLIDPAHRGQPPVVPEIVHLITTNFANRHHYSSVEKRNEKLKEKILELYRQFGHSEPEMKIDPLVDPGSGETLTDVRTQHHNVIYADKVNQVVKHYADDPDTSIHMSLAGGRKTMSSYDHEAMMFFGRDQDKMSHVLVEPLNFEQERDFWWPNQKEPLSVAGDGHGNSISSSTAQIDLIDLPFLRLNVRLPNVEQEALNHRRIIEFFEFERNQGSIIVDADKRCITVGNVNIVLSQNQFAFFALYSIAKHDNWPGVGSKEEGEGPHAGGWLRLRDFNYVITRLKNERRKETRALFVLRLLLGRYWNNSLMDSIEKHIDGQRPDPTDTTRSRLKTKLEEGIANPFIEALLVPDTYKGSEGTNVGLQIPSHRIRLKGFTE